MRWERPNEEEVLVGKT